MATQNLGLHSLPMNQGSAVVDDEHELQTQHLTDNSKSNKQPLSNWIFISFLIILSLLLIVITFGVSILTLQAVQSQPKPPEIVTPETYRNFPQQSTHQYLPIALLNEIPLDQIDKMETLTLQWGRTGSHEEMKYYFQIEYAIQDRKKDQTTLGLSSGHKLVAEFDKATLYSPTEEVLGVIQFFPSDQPQNLVDEDVQQFLQRVSTNRTRVIDDNNLLFPTEKAPPRQLAGKGKYGRYPYNVNHGLPQSFFDAYCRYGCGGMAVTFPYYYRPFFGYGFPLVGTEALFPQGYGGYPAAEILASQASVNAIQGTSSPSPTNGGGIVPPVSNGATNGGGATIPNIGSTLAGAIGSIAGGLGGLPVSIPIP